MDQRTDADTFSPPFTLGAIVKDVQECSEKRALGYGNQEAFSRNLESTIFTLPANAIAQKSGSESIVERAAHATEKSAKKGRKTELPTLS